MRTGKLSPRYLCKHDVAQPNILVTLSWACLPWPVAACPILHGFSWRIFSVLHVLLASTFEIWTHNGLGNFILREYSIFFVFFCFRSSCESGHRELKLDGAIGDFAEPLWRLKTGHFTTYTVHSDAFWQILVHWGLDKPLLKIHGVLIKQKM